MPAEPIYLDYNATTPVDPAVRDAMLPYLGERFGNPSSQHAYGRTAREALTVARTEVAGLIGAQPEEILFTSGGTEATNHALKGLAFDVLTRPDRPQVVVSTVEHPATLETARFLEHLGFRLAVIEVDGHGRVDLGAMERALREPTLVVSLMHANNETGHAAAGGGSLPGSPTRAARWCTSMRPSRPARCRSTSPSSAPICSRSRGTSSTRRRALARCTSAGECSSRRSSTAPARSLAGVPEPRTCRTQSGSERPVASRARCCPAPRRG